MLILASNIQVHNNMVNHAINVLNLRNIQSFNILKHASNVLSIDLPSNFKLLKSFQTGFGFLKPTSKFAIKLYSSSHTCQWQVH